MGWFRKRKINKVVENIAFYLYQTEVSDNVSYVLLLTHYSNKLERLLDGHDELFQTALDMSKVAVDIIVSELAKRPRYFNPVTVSNYQVYSMLYFDRLVYSGTSSAMLSLLVV